MIDYKRMARDIVKFARKPLKQNELDAALGFHFKKCSKWETGKNQIQWREFVTLCNVRNLSLAKAFDHLFSISTDPHKSDKIVSSLTASYDPVITAKTLNKSTSTLNRWRSGAIDPPLSSMLALINMHGILLQFLDILFGERPAFAQLKELQKNQDLYLKLQYDYPEAPLILTAMELKEFRRLPSYKPGWIANKIGIDPAREREILNYMLSLGMLRRTGQSYQPLIFGTDVSWSTKDSFQAHKTIKSHWFREAERLLKESTPENLKCRGGYIIYSVNDEVQDRIAKEAAAFYRNVLTIIENMDNSKNDKLAVIQYQILNYI